MDVDHTPSDSKDMTLNKGSLVRVVNSVLYPDSWLAWSVDETTGIDMELRRIPSPTKYVPSIIIFVIVVVVIVFFFIVWPSHTHHFSWPHLLTCNNSRKLLKCEESL